MEFVNFVPPKDIILHLSRIYKLKIEEKWILSEIPEKS
jgi:hypothetical protein